MKTISKLLVSSAVLGALGAASVNAADRVVLSGNDNINNNMANTNSLQLTDPAALVGLSANGALQIRKVYRDLNGDQTIRYQQMYKGIPVLGDDVIISRKKNGSFKSAHGAVVNGIAADVTTTVPKITASNAIKNAKAKTLISGAATYENESSRLAIWLDKNSKARLVFEVTYMQHSDQPSRPYMIIDALTGEVLHQYDNLQTANATGPGGNQKTGQYEYGTDFGYLDVSQSGSTCTMQNSNVKTVNLNHGTSGSSAYSFSCSRNTYKEINGAYSPLNDAHYFGNVVFDMYSDWYNTAPLTFQLTMRVHYSNNYENAFWNGSSMTFGDGANTFYPLVSLDVSAHEVSHGFTEQNSNLTYSGRSGGLNESFSDIAGEAAEFYMNGSNDWMVGAQIFKGNGSLRYMDDPTKDGRSIGHASDYTSGMDVHYSSGVYNKAFYLLANTNGWDTRKAFDIYVRANQQYWSSNTNWDQAGVGVLDAACDLGYSVEEVKASLTAVGVNANPSNSDCGGTEPPTGSELENGVPVTGLAASRGDDITYTMDVPAGATNIKFEISGGSGDADLYVKFGTAPTDSSYDCRPYKNGNNETCTGTNTGGTYYVRVKAYSSFSGVSLVGSYTTDGGNPGDPIDETITDISVAQGAWYYHSVDLSAGYSDLEVSISGGSGDADLYVRQGAQPTTSSYDCRPYKWGNSETCSFTSPAATTWYIGIRGYNASSGVTLNIKANP
ncbi:M4 family metallopeptidase [Aliikangiella sp. G2MR2-5]|uniref:M4 family metallopeptidase n=1 Tax=Aliikangiella sp. G2MR2-5 TaxID=2788943 RepID=UPI0018ABA470|nr:M4 family metallopeptidase [Aliikangiella sp. G2MR2-5]